MYARHSRDSQRPRCNGMRFPANRGKSPQVPPRGFSISPNCQFLASAWPVARTRRHGIVGAIGHLRPNNVEGTPCGACKRLPPRRCYCCRLIDVASAGSRSRAASSGSITATARAAPRSMKARPISINVPFMPVFNNLVMFKQDVAQNSVDSIVPDLAESWAWSSDNKKLTFKLKQGVKWHDGKPFTSADVKCTFDMLMGKSQQKFRQNPRKSWYDQVNDVTVNGDFEASFELKRPQPALLSLLASGYTPVYPCHVSPARCAPSRSAPARSNSSSSRPTNRSSSPGIPITSRRACRISTASNSPSSRTVRRRFSDLSPASST